MAGFLKVKKRYGRVNFRFKKKKIITSHLVLVILLGDTAYYPEILKCDINRSPHRLMCQIKQKERNQVITTESCKCPGNCLHFFVNDSYSPMVIHCLHSCSGDVTGPLSSTEVDLGVPALGVVIL